MTKKNIIFIQLLLVSFIFHLNCSSQRHLITEPIKKPLRIFKILEIPKLSTYLQSGYEVDVLNSIPDKIVEEISQYNRLHRDNPLFEEVSRENEQIDDVLLMRGTLVSYESGSRAKRWLIGMGSGKAYITVLVEFIDKANDESIGKIQFEGEISGGIFGGGTGGTAKGVVKAIMKYFESSM